MDLLQNISLEQLGVTGILVAYMWNRERELRNDLRDEREYCRRLSELYKDSTLKTIETMSKLEAAFTALKDKLP